MALRDDLQDRVSKIMKDTWSRRNGTVVPSDTSVTLGNDGVDIDAVVLYADLRGSTGMVDKFDPRFAAEVYKSFLYCAARVVTSEGGAITSYDGDRIMAVYIGDAKNTSAARTGLKINWVSKNIIQPAINAQYGASAYTLKHTVGIDASTLLVAKTGARGANDLVWVGKAANHAAKLTELTPHVTYITAAVYNVMAAEAKFANAGSGVDMWKPYNWTQQSGRRVYGSDYSWSI